MDDLTQPSLTEPATDWSKQVCYEQRREAMKRGEPVPMNNMNDFINAFGDESSRKHAGITDDYPGG